MCPGGHHLPPYGWCASVTRTVRNPLAPSSRTNSSSSFNRSKLNTSEPPDPFTSKLRKFLRPGQKLLASSVPTAPVANSRTASMASSTSTTPSPRSRRGGRGVAHLRGLRGGTRQRLLTQYVEPARGGGNRRLGMHVVGTCIDQDLYAPVVNQPPPVRVGGVRAVALGRLLQPVRGSSGDRDQQRTCRERPEDRRDALDGQEMRPGHPFVSEHPDADLRCRPLSHSTAWATLWMPAMTSLMSWSANKGCTSRCTARWRIASVRGNCPFTS